MLVHNSISNKKTASSIFWVVFEKFGYSFLNLLFLIVFARLLSPEDFGVISSVIIIVSISSIMVEAGFGAALVKEKDISLADYSTVFLFNLFASVFLYLIAFSFADEISNFYNKPEIALVIKTLSTIFIFNALVLVQRVHLIRELKFKLLSKVSILSFFSSSVVSVLLAWLGYGVWSLVAQKVLYSIFFSVSVFILVKFIPAPVFSVVSFKKLFSFGGRVTFGSLINTLYNDGVYLVISKAYSLEVTGFYSQARNLTNVPVNVFRSIYDGAVFPLLSRVEDADEFSKLFYNINRSVYLISFPILLFLPFKSYEIVLLVLGDNWIGVGAVLKIISVGAVVSVIELASLNAIKSFGDARAYLKIGISKSVLGLVVVLSTVNFGLIWMLIGVVVVNIITAFFAMLHVGKITEVTFLSQILEVFKILGVAILALLLSHSAISIYSFSLHVDLLAYVLVTTVVYFIFLRLFKFKEVEAVLNICHEQILKMKRNGNK